MARAAQQKTTKRSKDFKPAELTRDDIEPMVDEVADLQARAASLKKRIDEKKALIKRYQMNNEENFIETERGHTAKLYPNTTTKANKELAQQILSPKQFVRIFRTVTDESNPKLTIK